MKQETFTTILNNSFKSHERRMLKYMVENREKYLGFARLIKPNLDDIEQIYSRIAFAILSANARFDFAVKALNYAVENKGRCREVDMMTFTMFPQKAKYCNDAWQTIKDQPFNTYLKIYSSESWSQYRYRLQSAFKGLGIVKASFAACLLYPLESDLAVIDTWIQKVFLGNSSFKEIGKAKYEIVEAQIRAYGRKVGVNTFIAHWMIWNHVRDDKKGHAMDHNVFPFPGSHK